MKLAKALVLATILFGGSRVASAQAEFEPDTIVATLQRVAAFRMNDATLDNSWGLGGTYYPGIMAVYNLTKQPKYLSAAMTWANRYSWKPFNTALSTDGDDQTCFQTYAEIYLEDSLPTNAYMIQPADANFANMFDKAPLSGKLWPWLDLMYMAPAGMVRVAKAENKTRYVDSMDVYWQNSSSYYLNSTYNLYYRSSTYFGTTTFWARGNGWIFGGLARVIPYLPKGYKDSAKFATQFKNLAAELASIQQSNGLWTSDLIHPTNYPQKETSGSAFFCYGLAWGINSGLLDRTKYEPVVRNAWTGLVGCLNANGSLGWVQGPDSKPGPTSASGNQPYAEGAFMLAGAEIYKMYRTDAVASPEAASNVSTYSANQKNVVALRGETIPVPDGARSFDVYTMQGTRILSGRLDSGSDRILQLSSRDFGNIAGSRIVRFNF